MQKRTDYAEQADVHPHYQSPETGDPAEYTPIAVRVGHPVKTYQQSAQFGIYATFVIPPGSANATLVLPEDPDRLRAVVQINNSSVVLCNTQSAAQAPGNIAAVTTNLPTAPAGFVIKASTGNANVTIESQSAVWAINTDPTTVAYVSVCVERVNP
jgi:hypothetical protein